MVQCKLFFFTLLLLLLSTIVHSIQTYTIDKYFFHASSSAVRQGMIKICKIITYYRAYCIIFDNQTRVRLATSQALAGRIHSINRLNDSKQYFRYRFNHYEYVCRVRQRNN